MDIFSQRILPLSITGVTPAEHFPFFAVHLSLFTVKFFPFFAKIQYLREHKYVFTLIGFPVIKLGQTEIRIGPRKSFSHLSNRFLLFVQHTFKTYTFLSGNYCMFHLQIGLHDKKVQVLLFIIGYVPENDPSFSMDTVSQMCLKYGGNVCTEFLRTVRLVSYPIPVT